MKKGCKHNKNSIRKMSISQKLTWKTHPNRGMFGKEHSIESKEKMSRKRKRRMIEKTKKNNNHL